MLKQARDADWVDYASVTALKMAALRLARKGFAKRDDEQMAAFRQFVMQEGESLYWQAAFDALHAYQIGEDEMRWGWPVWPEAYQSVDTPEVKAFCETHADEVDFYLWLQWLAYSQFAACWQVSGAITCRSVCIAIWPSAWRKVGRRHGVTVNFTV